MSTQENIPNKLTVYWEPSKFRKQVFFRPLVLNENAGFGGSNVMEAPNLQRNVWYVEMLCNPGSIRVYKIHNFILLRLIAVNTHQLATYDDLPVTSTSLYRTTYAIESRKELRVSSWK